MSNNRSRLQSLRIRAGLIIIGIGLGMAARSLFGDPSPPQERMEFVPIPEELRDRLEAFRQHHKTLPPSLDNIGEPIIDDFSAPKADFPPLDLDPPTIPGSKDR